jgi:hypothetical protein
MGIFHWNIYLAFLNINWSIFKTSGENIFGYEIHRRKEEKSRKSGGGKMNGTAISQREITPAK